MTQGEIKKLHPPGTVTQQTKFDEEGLFFSTVSLRYLMANQCLAKDALLCEMDRLPLAKIGQMGGESEAQTPLTSG